MQILESDMTEDEVNQLKDIFHLFDYDKSGTISGSELRQSLNSLGSQKANNSLAFKLITEI